MKIFLIIPIQLTNPERIVLQSLVKSYIVPSLEKTEPNLALQSPWCCHTVGRSAYLAVYLAAAQGGCPKFVQAVIVTERSVLKDTFCI